VEVLHGNVLRADFLRIAPARAASFSLLTGSGQIALREMLARLSPHSFSLASPGTVRDAIRRHFQAVFARNAVEGLALRHPDKSAKTEAWLTRQFTVEYCALFDALLPALDRLNLPIPLGGTSNHFRASALKWLMAWDPFNVTEDADLGMRLARAGYLCQVLDSTTYEEAPRRFMCWLRQRTRWLKGYMQTWLVHMRFPRALWRELGPRGFLAFQINDRRHRAVGAGASLVLWAAGL
jgi:Glycosyl transferase family group 2